MSKFLTVILQMYAGREVFARFMFLGSWQGANLRSS